MPKAIDLAGRTCGNVTVLERTKRIGGRTAWKCRCRCGAIVEFRTAELTTPRYMLACSDCGGPKRKPSRTIKCAACGREFEGKTSAKFCSQECRLARRRGRFYGVEYAGPVIEACVICGTPFRRDRGRNNVCSKECRREKRRRQTLACWHRRVARDPGRIRELYLRRKAKAAEDPAFGEKLKEWDCRKHRKHRKRMREDPEYAEAHRQRRAEFWLRNRDRLVAKRKARLDAMSPSELTAWLLRMRKYVREWRRRKWAGMSPEQLAQARDKQREYLRQKRRLAIYLESQHIERTADERDRHRLGDGGPPLSEPA